MSVMISNDTRMQPPVGMPRGGGVIAGMGGGKAVKMTQTDLTAEKIEELESRSSSELEVSSWLVFNKYDASHMLPFCFVHILFYTIFLCLKKSFFL